MMPPTAQVELPLDPPEFPDLAADGAAMLTVWLMAHPKGPAKDGSWPGRTLAQQFNQPWNERTRRKLRAFREAAGPMIVSGPYGYKHVAHASLETREAAAKVRLSQAQKMGAEALRELNAIAAARKISGT